MKWSDILLLGMLAITHWAVVLFFVLYVHFRKNSKYDILFIGLFIIVGIQWKVFDECLISYCEKKILDNNYVTTKHNSEYHPSLHFYHNHPYIVDSMNFIMRTAYLYAIYTLLTIYKVPFALKILAILPMATYFLEYYNIYFTPPAVIEEPSRRAI
jgi:hypothetical protein